MLPFLECKPPMQPENMQRLFRSIPSVDRTIEAVRAADAGLRSLPQEMIKPLIVAFWDQAREKIKKGEIGGCLDLQSQLPDLLAFLHKGMRPALRPVFNGTGVVIHTNLGRSVLADAACEAIFQAARNYCNLEFSLETGERGSRHSMTSGLLARLTGAEDSLVVNNNAAAVFLLLNTLCSPGEVIVSRGELVEIGGSFRIPDIMLKSGAVLREVGTTNRTHLHDYSNAINENTRAILRVHTSNFRIVGFHKAVPLAELGNLARENELPLLVDLGSGNLLDFEENGLPHEPTVREVLAQGADCVCFSGDKLLGGPQAGIIAGKSGLVEQLKKNPLTRALRCGKLTLAGLEATLRLYLDAAGARETVPVARMLSVSAETLAKNARSLAAAIRRAFRAVSVACGIKMITDTSRVGGGAYPEFGLPTTLVCLYPERITAQELKNRLLRAQTPLLGRLEKDAFCLDPRTLQPSDYRAVAQILAEAMAEP